MGILDDLGKKYRTDKASHFHGYLDIYEKYFDKLKSEKINVVEIGVLWGQSLRMWKEYFPNATIYGIDLVLNKMSEDRIKILIANQEKREDLVKVSTQIGDIDIIIDDGGHTMLQQQVTLGCLFKYLKVGGIFVIEDLFTSRMLKPRIKHQYNKTGTLKTTLNMCNEMSVSGKIDSEFMTPEEAKYIEEHLKFCEVSMGKRSEICFIGKK